VCECGILVGDGPVGIDLMRSGANVAIVSTGFNDSTYSITVVSAAGAAVSNTKHVAPTGCTAPGHATGSTTRAAARAR